MFTLPEIQVLYETTLGKTLHRRNFPNKLMSLGILVKTGEKRKIGQHRSPFLYRFNKEK
jgi:8-oxo-dGTP diphosphatase